MTAPNLGAVIFLTPPHFCYNTSTNFMQLTRQDIQIVEKVITTEKGVFLARFAVAMVGGALKAKLVSMVPFEASESLQNKPFLLENPRPTQKVIFVEPCARKIVSPYAELFFLSSISPRAPNLV